MKTKLLKKIRWDLRIISASDGYHIQYFQYDMWENIFKGTLCECIEQRHRYMKKRLLEKGYFKIIG